jgi:hypothetical protein
LLNYHLTHSLTHSLTYILFILIVFLFFNQCSNEPPTEANELLKSTKEDTGLNLSITGDSSKTKDKDKEKDKDKDKGGEIVPNAASQCQKVVNYWLFDHYENVSGKIVGILPRADTWDNINKLWYLKDTLGFNSIVAVETKINHCIQAGYSSQTIMIGGFNLNNNDYQRVVQLYPGFLGYYTDEPISDQGLECIDARLALLWFRYFLNNNNSSNSLLVVGETIHDLWGFRYYSSCIADRANILMCTRYINGFPWYEDDQRPIWTDWKSAYPTEFKWTWISYHSDYNEFSDLLGHAINLSLQGVWLYQYGDGLPSNLERNRLESYSLNAWRWGWLRRVERKWTHVYECINQNPCNCDPYTLGSEWILVDKFPTYETRTLTY